MNSAVVGVIGLVAFLFAYRFYSRYLSVKIFGLTQLDTDKIPTPAHEFRDNIDFTPTKKNILLGHHFSSIAGAAPIVGPAVAAIWGWGPALLWILFGVIFLGASHDMGALMISMKHHGNSMAFVAEKLLGKRARSLFLIVIFFLVWMVIAVFALVIANLFVKFPSSVLPVNFEIIIAIIMGVFINKSGKSLTLPSILAQLALLGMIILGTHFPIGLKSIFPNNELMAWIIFLLIYSFIASTLPVWMLLQPRDYINSHQLITGLTLMILGLIITAPAIQAPIFNPHPTGAPPWFPFLFITIACGAISGFHGLVSGGTSSKQVSKWAEARPIGFGSMLGEGLLALLATLAVTTGFKSSQSWHNHYSSWNHANGLSNKIEAFVQGAGSFVAGLGIPIKISQTVIAVLIISFAATSLDTACRIQRYIIGEFGRALQVKSLENRFFGSALAVLSAFLLMLTSSGGKGGLHLWPLFGATNQMLAGLTLILITVWLKSNKRPSLSYFLPTIFILFTTTTALILNIKVYLENQKYFLAALALALFLAQLWTIALAISKLFSKEKETSQKAKT